MFDTLSTGSKNSFFVCLVSATIYVQKSCKEVLKFICKIDNLLIFRQERINARGSE